MHPEIILTISRINITFKVSLKLLFLSSTSNPKPPFDSNPLIAAPKEIVPFMSIIVIAIDMAQFGIKPIKAAAAHCKYECVFCKKKSVTEKCSKI
jgi:hypothetical protein